MIGSFILRSSTMKMLKVFFFCCVKRVEQKIRIDQATDRIQGDLENVENKKRE
jgi:hypothetical protein